MKTLNRMLVGSALLSLVTLCGTAQADFGLDRGASTRGIFLDENDAISNDVNGDFALAPDGSFTNHLGCFGSQPGEIGCTLSSTPWPQDDWWDRPYPFPTLAAAQAYADFGTLRGRSVVVRQDAGDGQIFPSPGHREYSATTISAWREDLYNLGTQPTTVTFDFSIDATWSDFGRFALTLGEEYFGFDQYEVDGVVYKNCELGSTECNVAPGEGTLIHVPGDDPENENGSFHQIVSFSLVLGPSFDPEDQTLMPVTFLAQLETFAFLNGAEIDAYQTVTLDRIRVEPGAQLDFGSDTAWNIEVVPEPATYALWLTGLAAIAAGRLRQRR